MTIILLPLFYQLAGMLLNSSQYDFLANGLIRKFIFSPQGFGLVIIGSLLGLWVILVELGGLIVISNDALLDEHETSFLEIAKYTLSKIKYLLGLDGILILFYFFLVAPMIDSNLKTSLIQNLSIPNFYYGSY